MDKGTSSPPLTFQSLIATPPPKGNTVTTATVDLPTMNWEYKPKNKTQARAAAGLIGNAKQIILTDGWAIGNFLCDDGKKCAVGALRAAAGHHPDDLPVDDHIYNVALVAVQETIAKVTDDLKREVAENVADFFVDVDEEHGYDEITIASLAEGGAEAAVRAPIEAIEEIITTFNDHRVKTNVGRNTVLRRFDKAIAALTA